MDLRQVMNGWSAGRKVQGFLLSGLVLLGVLACASRIWPDGEKGPQHGWWQGNGPVVSHESFPLDCELCHEGKDWTTLRADFEFDHLAETGFALQGAHTAAKCLRCHNDRGPVQRFSSQGCAGCHVDLHQGQQGKACQDCHGQDSWNLLASIRDHAGTRFPLIGAHAGTACRQCHIGIEVGNMAPLDVACESCHGGLESQVVDPDHMALAWTQNCEDCHQPTTWGGRGFLHTGFPLTGAHAQADCNQCHAGNVFEGTPRNCVDCHQPEYDGTTDPNHVAAGFPTTCDACHSTTSWAPATFTHTSFPITGAHRLVGCNQCHTAAIFAGLPSDCVDCHQNDYDGTSEPPHVAAGFSTDCQACHTTVDWNDAILDHSTYPLTGAHLTIDCSQCHVGGVFQGTPRNCVDCHLSEYQGTTNPDHQALGFSTACEGCHDTDAWLGAAFNHAFPITSGDHAGFNCTECHLNIGSNDFSCIHCHEHRQSEMDDKHDEVGGYIWSNAACYDCHPDGRDLLFQGPNIRRAPGRKASGSLRRLLNPR